MYVCIFILFLVIAINEVDDVRPVMDYYKSKGGKDFLTVFRGNHYKPSLYKLIPWLQTKDHFTFIMTSEKSS